MNGRVSEELVDDFEDESGRNCPAALRLSDKFDLWLFALHPSTSWSLIKLDRISYARKQSKFLKSSPFATSDFGEYKILTNTFPPIHLAHWNPKLPVRLASAKSSIARQTTRVCPSRRCATATPTVPTAPTKTSRNVPSATVSAAKYIILLSITRRHTSAVACVRKDTTSCVHHLPTHTHTKFPAKFALNH